MPKTVTGNAFVLTSAAAANSTIRFSYASAPGVAGGGLIVSEKSVYDQISLVGEFSVVLVEGYYHVTIDDSPNDRWIISVDDVTETVDIVDIIVSAVGESPTPSETIPIASATVYGKMKRTSADYVLPETVGTVAAARLLGKVRCGECKIVIVLGYTSEGDGGGGFFFWKVGGTDADDGAQYLRPSDYAGDGVLQKFL